MGIVFKEKIFAEYDAMRTLYVELMKHSDHTKFEIIDTSSLIPILKGNNVVIEKFVTNTSFLSKPTYRMYLKIGARAKLPDEVRLVDKVYDKRLGGVSVELGNRPSKNDKKDNNQNNNRYNNQNTGGHNNNQSNGGNYKNRGQKNYYGNRTEKRFSDSDRISLFSDMKFVSEFKSNSIDLNFEVRELLADAILYDKKTRSLVLETKSISDAISALNILPFGLGYKIYLLDS